jgi:hypothetical protein
MALNLRSRDVRLATRSWLATEQRTNFYREFGSATKTTAQNRLNEIYQIELPNIWRVFQEYQRMRDAEVNKRSAPQLRLYVGQKLLLACAKSQDAYVWDKVLDGKNAKESMEASFKTEINHYYDDLNEGKALLPHKDRLRDPFRVAVDTIAGKRKSYGDPLPTFRAVVGLAITGILEQWPVGTPLILPEPGHLPGNIIPKEYPTRRPVLETDY